MKSKPKEGDLRVWWIPQMAARVKTFHVDVLTVIEAKLLLDTLANYDLFQFDNNIKPDYCNAGGLEVWEDDEWCAWYSDGRDIDEMELDEMRSEFKTKP